MYVVAHEDDDLLFMNPDIARSIAAGNHVVIVHLTTGDLTTESVATFGDQRDPPDFTGYWIDRERGILNAFTAMALGHDAAFTEYEPAGSVPAGWTAQVIDEGGIAMPRYDLGQVSAVFVRLSDAQLWEAWNDEPGAGGQAGGVMLPPGTTITDGCTDATVCPLATMIPSQQVTRDQLIDALAALIEDFHVDSVSAQDATTPTKGDSPAGMFWDELGTPDEVGYTDYWDHVYGAAFVLAAATRAQPVLDRGLSLRLYRDYTISQEPPNLALPEAVAKAQVFAYYALFDASIVPHYQRVDFGDLDFHSNGYDIVSAGSWQQRELATRTLVGAQPLHGRLAVAGSCIGIVASSPALVACDGAASWIATERNQLQDASSANCLAVAANRQLVLAPCSPPTAASTLFVFANGQIRSADAQCLDASLVAAECAHEPLAPHATGRVPASQDFTLLFDSPRVLAARGGDALSIVQQQACIGSPGELACAPYQSGALGSAAQLAALPANATDIAAVEAGALVACSRANGIVSCGSRTSRDHAGDDLLRYVDLAGSGAIDLCGRTHAGVSCSRDNGGEWSAAARWTSSFSDADSIQLADIDGDGLADVCGRSSRGLECAAQLAGAFADHATWSFDEDRDVSATSLDFSDTDPDEPWPSSDALYGSLRLVDINHDGLADACARGAAGVYCALSTGTAFERKKLVAPAALLEATALAWGDLDGDGRIDACGLVAAGLACVSGY
jgi:hypothetical protein